MLASYHALKAEVQIHLNRLSPLFLPKHSAELTKMIFFFFLRLARSLPSGISAFCVRNNPASNSMEQYTLDLRQLFYFVNTNTRPRNLFSNRPVFCSLFLYYGAAAPYLVKKMHWQQTFCHLCNIAREIFKESTTHFRLVFCH